MGMNPENAIEIRNMSKSFKIQYDRAKDLKSFIRYYVNHNEDVRSCWLNAGYNDDELVEKISQKDKSFLYAQYVLQGVADGMYDFDQLDQELPAGLTAFYQKSLEPILKRTGESFTKPMFTGREKGFGNKIKMFPHELIFMDTSQKIELFNLLVDSASCYKNEVRTAFGMRPLPELAGQIAMSSNKSNAENNKIENEGNQSIGGNENEE